MRIRTAAASLAFVMPLCSAAAPSAPEGAKLVEASKCEACHQREFRGPVGAIYVRKDRKVTSWAKLKSQVAQCNTALNIGLFPEDEEHIAAFLDETWYRFRAK